MINLNHFCINTVTLMKYFLRFQNLNVSLVFVADIILRQQKRYKQNRICTTSATEMNQADDLYKPLTELSHFIWQTNH